MAPALLESLIRFFYPGACPACLGASSADVLCGACARAVPFASGLMPPDALAGLPVFVPCLYAGVVRDLVLDLKFGRNPHPARALGALLAAGLCASGFARHADSIVPLPLSRRRLRHRGFNQAERIADVLGRARGAPVLASLLARPVHRPPQADLGPGERGENVRGVFRARDGVFGRAILLVDDVITTGHTMAEAAATLLQGGARQVSCCAVAASGWEAGRMWSQVLLRSAGGAR